MSQAKLFFGLKQCAFIFLVTVVASVGGSAAAQTPTRSMVETHVRAIIAAYTAHDPETITRLDPAAPGFGFRTLQARPADRPYMDALKTFLANQEYYRIELNDLHTEVDGDVGLAWGFWTEDFKGKGQSPERVRVRFTFTFKHDGQGWRTLLYHRDAQRFDERGAYLRNP